jgi:LexA-binding, inner membrane-associated putative hydrolase
MLVGRERRCGPIQERGRHMANFTTHIAIGTLVSGALATLTLAADVIAPENLVAVTVAGVLGSVLPDIDLKDSRPSHAMFSGLALFFSFVVLFTFAHRFSVAELWILWLGTILLVRYFAHFVFHRMSYHRGIYHSILAGAFFACFTAVIYRRMLDRPEGVAWLAGGFMFIGYMVHLTLDEIYSVDVMDTRIKSSFGTALKLIDKKHPGHSAAMALATVAAFTLAPSTKSFVDGVRSRAVWAGLHERLLPKDRWFGIVAWHRHLATEAAPAGSDRKAEPVNLGEKAAPTSSGLSTGSIAVEPKPGEQR